MIHYRIPLKYFLKKKKGTRSLKISTNRIYAGVHWGQRKTVKDRILDTAGKYCSDGVSVSAYPVSIHYRFIFRTRALDTLNTAYMAKMFEDAFRSLGIIEDDTPQYVAQSILEVVALPSAKASRKAEAEGDEDGDMLEVTILPHESKSNDQGPFRQGSEAIIPCVGGGPVKA